MIIEPEHGAAPPAGQSPRSSQGPQEAANYTSPSVAPQQPVSMETEEDVTTAKEEQQGDRNVDEGPDQSNHVTQSHHQDGEHEKMMEEEEENTEEEADEKREAIGSITSTVAAQGTTTKVQDHSTCPQEDQHHKTSPLERYDSYKPVQPFQTSPLGTYSRTSPLQDHFANIQEENYKIHRALSPPSPDIIEVHSDHSEDRDFDDVDADDDKDSLSQRSTMTDESEIFDISRGNLGLLEQAIALKAEQVKPAGQRELFCSPDVHQQRYITVEDRPKHLDAIRKSYFNKGRTQSGRRADPRPALLAAHLSTSWLAERGMNVQARNPESITRLRLCCAPRRAGETMFFTRVAERHACSCLSSPASVSSLISFSPPSRSSLL